MGLLIKKSHFLDIGLIIGLAHYAGHFDNKGSLYSANGTHSNLFFYLLYN